MERPVIVPSRMKRFVDPDHRDMGWQWNDFQRVRDIAGERGVLTSFGDRPWKDDEVPKLDSRWIWDCTRLCHNGEHLPNLPQETGDCVSFGAASAISYRAAFEGFLLGEEEIFYQAFQPWIYGVSRGAPECGDGRLFGAGSTGGWAAIAVNLYGVLFGAESPEYSGSLANSWGRRLANIPDEYFELAKNNPVRSVVEVTTIDQIREELLGYRPVTVASNQGYESTDEITGESGRRYIRYKARGRWAHQMVLLAWTDECGGMAYQLNSWGPSHTPTPLNGEPPGGAWVLASDLEKVLRSSYAEFYSFGDFVGETDEPNHFIA